MSKHQATTVEEAKQRVVRAGRRLVEAGLIARTWGNVSARVGDDRFVITPSGRPYESLTTADIVTVRIADESWTGDVKPSSEKGVHAAVYRRRPDVGFVIHTHQTFASAVSTLRTDVAHVPADLARVLGPAIYCVDFALPTTKKLANNVAAALERADGDAKALLLASHGTVCLGRDDEEAFAVAEALEEACRRHILRRAGESARQTPPDPPAGHAADWGLVRSLFAGGAPPAAPRPLYNSRRFGDGFRLYLAGTGADPFPDDPGASVDVRLAAAAPTPGDLERHGAIPPEAEIHRLIYVRRRHIRAIVHETSPDVVAVSRRGRAVPPMVDDFAQIIGPAARCVPGGALSPSAIGGQAARLLRGNYAVMLQGNGALCAAPNPGDAAAAAQVLAKNCTAVLAAHVCGGGHTIPWTEAWLLRAAYLLTYSKRAAS